MKVREKGNYNVIFKREFDFILQVFGRDQEAVSRDKGSPLCILSAV